MFRRFGLWPKKDLSIARKSKFPSEMPDTPNGDILLACRARGRVGMAPGGMGALSTSGPEWASVGLLWMCPHSPHVIVTATRSPCCAWCCRREGSRESRSWTCESLHDVMNSTKPERL
jgi:hypothetical protein